MSRFIFPLLIFVSLVSVQLVQVDAGCQACTAPACKFTFQTSQETFDANCGQAQQIEILPAVALNPDCGAYLLERFCTFFKAISELNSRVQCSVEPKRFCRSECLQMASCLVSPNLLGCDSNSSPDGDCTVLPTSPFGVPSQDIEVLPEINETRFTEKYQVGAILSLSDNPVLGSNGVNLARLLKIVYETAVDDINRMPNVLPYTKLELLTNDTAGRGSKAVGAALYNLQGPLQQMLANGFAGNSPVIPSSLTGQNNVIGLIGGMWSDEVLPPAMLAANVKMPFINTAAYNMDISPLNNYFLRVFPGLANQGDAILGMVKFYGWKRIALIYEKSFKELADRFEFTTASNNITEYRAYPYNIYPKVSEMMMILQTIQTLDLRIIIFHSSTGYLDQFALNTAAERLGMLGNEYVFLGMTSSVPPAAFTVEERRKWMPGFINLGEPTFTAPRYRVVQAKLLKKMFSAPDIQWLDPNSGTNVSQSDTFRLAMVVSFMVYSYDAIWLYAHALRQLQLQGQPVTGQNLFNAMRTSNFSGITNNLQFLANGDRQAAYEILNYNSDTLLMEVKAKWDTINGYSQVIDPQSGLARLMVWPSGSTTVPADSPIRLMKTVGTGYLMTTNVLAALGLLLSLVIHYMLFRYREREVVKAANHVFCHLIVSGSLFAYVAVLLTGLQETEQVTCWLFPLLICICFDMVMGALFVKTWTIHFIFNSKMLRLRRMSKLRLMLPVGLLVAYEIIITIAWVVTDEPKVVLTSYPLSKYTDVYTCKSVNEGLWSFLYLLPKAFVLGFGAYIAFRVRNVADKFNETKHIFVVMYFIIIMSVMVLVLRSQLPQQVDAVHLITGVGIFLVVVNTLLVLFVPKFLMVWTVDPNDDSATPKVTELSPRPSGGTVKGSSGPTTKESGTGVSNNSPQPSMLGRRNSGAGNSTTGAPNSGGEGHNRTSSFNAKNSSRGRVTPTHSRGSPGMGSRSLSGNNLSKSASESSLVSIPPVTQTGKDTDSTSSVTPLVTIAEERVSVKFDLRHQGVVPAGSGHATPTESPTTPPRAKNFSPESGFNPSSIGNGNGNGNGAGNRSSSSAGGASGAGLRPSTPHHGSALNLGTNTPDQQSPSSAKDQKSADSPKLGPVPVPASPKSSNSNRV